MSIGVRETAIHFKRLIQEKENSVNYSDMKSLVKQQYLKHKGLKFRKRGKDIEYKSVAFVVMQKNKNP